MYFLELEDFCLAGMWIGMQGIDALYFTNLLNMYCARLRVIGGMPRLYGGDTLRAPPMTSMALWSSVRPCGI